MSSRNADENLNRIFFFSQLAMTNQKHLVSGAFWDK